MPPLSPYPLCSTTVEFNYCLDQPLRCLATRFVPHSRPAHAVPGRTTCSLLICCGISLQPKTWLPVIERLYNLTSQPASHVSIHSIWVIERPNHGDAALLNEASLKEHYPVIFPSRQYGAAIRAFLASNILSDCERANLIAVGYSGAGGSLLQALEPAMSNLPITRFIFVELPHIGPEAWPALQELYKAVKVSNSRRQTSWSSVDEAMRYLKLRPPVKYYHPEVWQVMSETYFRQDPQDPERVTTKTTVEQETACFVDDGKHLSSFDYFRSIWHLIPSHFVHGSVEDIWPKEIYRQQGENLKRNYEHLASVKFIEGAGHYLPVQMPEELAREMARILNEHARNACAMTTRL